MTTAASPPVCQVAFSAMDLDCAKVASGSTLNGTPIAGSWRFRFADERAPTHARNRHVIRANRAGVGFVVPLSHRNTVLSSTWRRCANRLREKPLARRAIRSHSPKVAGAVHGAYPRNSMIRGIRYGFGSVSLRSHLSRVDGEMATCVATSLWRNLSRTRLRRKWSPRVLSSLTYEEDGGFFAVNFV